MAFAPAIADAAIGIGTVRSAIVSSGTTLDITNVAISGADRYLLVGLCYGPEDIHTTVSVVLDPGGASQTSLTHLDNATAVFDNDTLCQLWGTAAPPVGTFTVRSIITTNLQAGHDMIGGAWPLTGVDPTNPRGTVVTNSGDVNGSPPSVTVASTAGEIVFGTAFVEAAATMQIQAPGVEDWELATNDAAGGAHSAGAASVTLNWTVTPVPDDKFAAIAVAMKPARTIAYSVGTNTADLKTGTPTIAITSGLATLSIAQAGPVGVGDVISYGAAPLVYIESVLSPTQFRVQLAAGGSPANTGAVAVNYIRRAFNSITSAVTLSSTASYLNTSSLVAINRRLNWVCYEDGPLVESATIDGYTTDANNFITLTVAGASQVANGASQRHSGLAGTGTVVRPPAAAPHGISVRDQYTVVEWLEVDGTNVTTANADGLEVEFGNGQDALFRNMIAHHWLGASGTALYTGLDRVTLRNSIVYANNVGIQLDGSNSILQNVTIYGSTGGYGFQDAASSGHTLENVVSMGNSNDDFCCGNATVFNNNMSEDVTATAYYTGAGNLTLRNPLDQFVSTTGFVDLHLKPGADAVNAGKSLAPTFSEDVDGQARPVAAAWDIGADEGGSLGAGGTMRVLSGSYVGNGTGGRPISVGFRPDIVIIDRNDPLDIADDEAVIRTSTMVGDASKDLDTSTAIVAGKIQSLDASGFTIGSDVDVNQNGIVYHWVAFRAAPGQLELGSYTGTGAMWDMTRLGMNPVYVIVMSEGAHRPIMKSSLMPANLSSAFQALAYNDAILNILPSGFRLGTNAQVNQNGTKVHYAAWASVPGRVAVGRYLGNNTAGTSIGPTGFLPEWAVVTRSNDTAGSQANVSCHKPASTGIAVDQTLIFDGTLAVNNNIQALHANGFTIGSHGRVNSNIAPDNVYYWAAFGPHSTTTTYYRSIGTALDLSNQGTITLSAGSTTVTATGVTGWQAANRGRGDRLTVGTDHYVIASVNSDSQLTLATPAVTSTTTSSYTIARQFTTLQQWEDCVSRSAINTCKRPADVQEYFATSTSSLVADDRREVGIAYEDSVFTLTSDLVFQGSITDATHTITLTADGANRHAGTAGAGVLVNEGTVSGVEIVIQDRNLTVEWLEIVGARGSGAGTCSSSGYCGAIRVHGAVGDEPQNVILQNLLIHDFRDAAVPANWISGIVLSGSNVVGKSVTVRNTMIWDGDEFGIWGDEPADTVLVENCSIDQTRYGLEAERSAFTVRNTIVTSTLSSHVDYSIFSGGSFTGSNNISSDASAAAHFTSPQTGVAATSLYVTPNANLHLLGTAPAVDAGVNLSASFTTDIDNGLRPAGLAWEIGADEFGATTEVRLLSFAAVASDSAVDLVWQTASELGNLGFHLYRSLGQSGPWTRITKAIVPGLGSSPEGKRYTWRDSGLENGVRYYYLLEDVDASSKTTSHGPVWATPQGGVRGADREGSSASCPGWVLAAYDASAGSSTASLRCTRHGEPEAVSLQVVSRDARQATLELLTGGFYALHEPAGGVRVFVPGFDFPQDPQAAALPFRRALVEAVVGRRVQLAGVRALEQAAFRGLAPAALGKAEMQVSWDGTVRPGRRASRVPQPRLPASELARLLPSVFQGETKSAVVELHPLRFDARRDQLLLAKRVRVRLLFTGRETSESGRGSHGRRRREHPRQPRSEELLARLYTTSPGLYAARFEGLLAAGSRPVPLSELRLERLGEPVAFHVEPANASFGPGSTLFFHAGDAAASLDFSSELAFELHRAGGGVQMPLALAAPGASPVASFPLVARSFETNRYYQPGLLEAPDPWLWEAVPTGQTRVVPFSLAGLAGSGSAELDVFLLGASESGRTIDHHLSVSLNGTLVGEAQFAGKRPYRVTLSLPAALLREGANELALTSVADTGVSSLVFLDRFELVHPHAPWLAGGRFEGTWQESGSVSLSGASAAAAVLDVTPAGSPRWLIGYSASADGVRFAVEAGRRYLAVAQGAALAPRVASPEPMALRASTNQADYLLIAPRAFLPAVQPLVERRAGQGLAARAVAFEEIVAEFGHGQPSAEAIREFLAHAFHAWARPSPRYVLLVGDGSYDPRRFMAASGPAPLPALWTRTSYLLTASDAQLAAVNGEDPLPDLAIGRLPATSVEQAEALVTKLLAWEDSGQGLAGRAALVADNPDRAGDFEADIRDIAHSYLAGRDTRLLLLSQLGAALRPQIQDALDSGLSYLSYVGHGGAAVWASENVWNSWDTPSLLAQSRQPLLITMNCLNGYYVAPSYESLAESLLKAEGRGAIAAFAPSGLSLDGPAHQYHRALMDALTGGQHQRLGDAVLAAQGVYAETGLMPELLAVYHLFGDPATPIRP